MRHSRVTLYSYRVIYIRTIIASDISLYQQFFTVIIQQQLQETVRSFSPTKKPPN